MKLKSHFAGNNSILCTSLTKSVTTNGCLPARPKTANFYLSPSEIQLIKKWDESRGQRQRPTVRWQRPQQTTTSYCIKK